MQVPADACNTLEWILQCLGLTEKNTAFRQSRQLLRIISGPPLDHAESYDDSAATIADSSSLNSVFGDDVQDFGPGLDCSEKRTADFACPDAAAVATP